jgi:hypothetical protein
MCLGSLVGGEPPSMSERPPQAIPARRGSGSITLSHVLRMIGRVLQEVKNIEGLRAKVWTCGQDESPQSHKSEDRKTEATRQWTTEARCVSAGTCRRPIASLKSDVLI